MTSAKLFLFNPGSVFFISLYAESTFCFVSLLTMLCCELKYFAYNENLSRVKGQCVRVHSVLLSVCIVFGLGVACALRSNGVVLAALPLYYHLYANVFYAHHITNATGAVWSALCAVLSTLRTRHVLKKVRIWTVNITRERLAYGIAVMFGVVWLLCLLSVAVTPWLWYHSYGKRRF